ncbi:MAG: NADH-quinone oxidoreductase subunit J [Proteiniphilum sp.]
MTQQIIFYLLAIAITVFSILAVTSKRIVRSATYLLFVLLATAGFYMLLGYYFLFAVQVSVYAGGIMVLFIMAIFLTHKPGKDVSDRVGWRFSSSLLLSVAGLLLSGYIILNNTIGIVQFIEKEELTMQQIGTAMLGAGKQQYLLSFEMMSILLLACIVGAILIARKTKTEKNEPNETEL